MRKWPSTTAFNGNGMMAPHPFLHGFEQQSPENKSEDAKKRPHLRKLGLQVPSALMPQREGMFPLCVGFDM